MSEKITLTKYTCKCAAGHVTTYVPPSESPPSNCDATDQFTHKACGRVLHCAESEYDPED